ncbi:hypothetical protein [Burkholderia mayonis]|uniref:Uncharacterized protein n=1 Tax=Burkholderia mayonis TaxID=1385591 RepID=A0A1B4G130_9BURK|nr:hypothetical protein [Burkholderia mayonis]AOJ09643.1 hypothetical protein WS71_20235 [Burkholderia mayonis]KVE52264.1 hypothetical protein WS71_10060 [Burkholderia mayonis]
MSQSRTRVLVDMVKDAGLEVLQHYGKSSRVCVDARAPNGAERTFNLSLRQGDLRGDLNQQAEIRRWARANMPPSPPAVDLPKPTITVKPRRSTVKKQNDTPQPSTTEQELTPREFYRLCEWLKQADCATVSGLDVLARAASNALGQEIGAETMKDAMDATETPEPDAWNPLPEPHVVVARELDALMRQLGHEPSAHFRRLLSALSA